MMPGTAYFRIALLTGLMIAGMMPPIDSNHAHSGGHLPHSHSGTDFASGRSIAEVHDHGHTHTHNTNHRASNDGSRKSAGNESAEHGHSHDNIDEDDVTGSGRHGTDSYDETLSSNASLDWHSHNGLLEWLTGKDWTSVSSDGNIYDKSAESYFVTCCPYPNEIAGSSFIRAAAIWIHGPPAWICHDPGGIPYRTGHHESSSPPLCDASRHERSGVLLI
jgi:hypothetical protein